MAIAAAPARIGFHMAVLQNNAPRPMIEGARPGSGKLKIGKLGFMLDGAQTGLLAPSAVAVLLLRPRAVRALRRMGAVEPGTGDFPQHAGKAAAAPEILLLLLVLRARPSLPVAARLRARNGRKSKDPCRDGGEERIPHDHSPKCFDAPSIKEGAPFSAS